MEALQHFELEDWKRSMPWHPIFVALPARKERGSGAEEKGILAVKTVPYLFLMRGMSEGMSMQSVGVPLVSCTETPQRKHAVDSS